MRLARTGLDALNVLLADSDARVMAQQSPTGPSAAGRLPLWQATDFAQPTTESPDNVVVGLHAVGGAREPTAEERRPRRRERGPDKRTRKVRRCMLCGKQTCRGKWAKKNCEDAKRLRHFRAMFER